MTLRHILIIDDIPVNIKLLGKILEKEGYRVQSATNGKAALELARRISPDLVLLDVRMPEMDGFEVCREIEGARTQQGPAGRLSQRLEQDRGHTAGLRFGRRGLHHQALRPQRSPGKGAHTSDHSGPSKETQEEKRPSFAGRSPAKKRAEKRLEEHLERLEDLIDERSAELRKEIEERNAAQLALCDSGKKLKAALEQLERYKDQLQKENIYLREEIRTEHRFDEIIGNSESIRYVLFRVRQVAPSDATVLILGETGSGKELVARAIHNASSRKERPLIKINCAALSANLIESELFGHEKGAYTGATAQRVGRFELADGATLFLDEIGELPPEAQAKLLRVLQDGEFERVGSSRTIKVDTRIVAATNRDIDAEVNAGRFRRDLFYRLSVYPLTIPPLRERIEDIPAMARQFVKRCNKKLGKRVERIPPETMESLQSYSWPGNVRELANVIEKAVITSRDDILSVELPSSEKKTEHMPRSLGLDENPGGTGTRTHPKSP